MTMTTQEPYVSWQPLIDHLRTMIVLAGQPTVRELVRFGARVPGIRPSSTGKVSQVLAGKEKRVDWLFVDFVLAGCLAFAREQKVPVLAEDFDRDRLYRLWRRSMVEWIARHPAAGTDSRYDPTSEQAPVRRLGVSRLTRQEPTDAQQTVVTVDRFTVGGPIGGCSAGASDSMMDRVAS